MTMTRSDQSMITLRCTRTGAQTRIRILIPRSETERIGIGIGDGVAVVRGDGHVVQVRPGLAGRQRKLQVSSRLLATIETKISGLDLPPAAFTPQEIAAEVDPQARTITFQVPRWFPYDLFEETVTEARRRGALRSREVTFLGSTPPGRRPLRLRPITDAERDRLIREAHEQGRVKYGPTVYAVPLQGM